MIPFTCHVQNRQIRNDRKEISGYQGGMGGKGPRVWKGEVMTDNGYRVSFWSEESVLKLDFGDGSTIL